ncbi:TonB-dependent receptor [Hyphomonas johnsonii]|uniref:TonB-dependent receptor n=1 Tax=Hyphomonas johnsonii TaxID=81031 RepID=UPI000556DB8D|nr:TonB-dependent receptor [Hyphomonas johnsonii]
MSFLIGALPAYAQSSETDAPPEDGVRKLGTIVVSTQKREQSLLDVGAAVSVIGGDALEFRDLANMSDISNSVPNVEYGEVAGASQITIRGIGLNVETGFAEPAVAVHLNGVFLGRSNAAALGLADLASVEVLRGPQGTLYGRNATGGVVNFTTNKPTDAFEAGATIGAGSFERRLARGYVSGPFSDTVRGRLSIAYEEDDGYIDNRTTGKTEGGLEATTLKGDLSWDITENLTSDIFFLTIDQDRVGPSFEKIRPGFLAGLAGFDDRPNNILNNRTPWSDIGMDVAGLTLDWKTDFATLRSITGYTTFDRVDFFDGDVTALDVLTSGRTEDAEAWSQEFNLIGNEGGRLDWIVGAFWMQEDSSSRTDVDTGSDSAILMLPPEISFTVNQLVEDLEAFGLFGDVTFNVSDTVRLKGGLRYSEEKKKGSQTVTFFDNTVVVCGDQVSDISFHDTTPKAGIEWDVAESTMLYAQYQEGFKSGGFNQAGCGSFEPEEVTSIEAGMKGQYFDGRLYLAASAFTYDYTNLQVLQIRNNTGFVENAADSTITGAELEAIIAVTDNLQAEAAISFLDATYDAFIDGAGSDFSGNTLNRAPEYTLSGALEYTVPVNSSLFGDPRLRAEVFVSDDVFYRPRNAADDMQDSYSVVNLYASLPLADDRLTVSFYAKNVTDEGYITNIISLIDGLDGHYARPASWGLELSAKW